jgi:molybdopterin molybdotransferase
VTRARLEPEEVISFDVAIELVRAQLRVLDPEEIALERAFGRVLADSIRAPHALPSFDNSMVDGYALRVDDVRDAAPERPVELRVIAEVAAGEASECVVSPGTAARIMTGAPVPASADGIAMLEWTSWDADRVRVERPVAEGQFIRRAGEDLRAGDAVFSQGTRLGAAHVGVLGALGIGGVTVRRRPTVAVLVTGDELLTVHEELRPGRIRSSNDLVLGGLAREAGGRVLDLGIARDDRGDLEERLTRGRGADVIVTSGGVSVGDHDEVQSVLTEMGFRRVFWRVASSPGKPLLFGTLGASLVFGLPGNPVSTSIAFENFVRPALRRLEGDARPDRPRVWARVVGTISGPPARRHFARVRVEAAPDGLTVREVGPHGSGNLRSMANANGLAIVREGVARLEDGELAEVLLIDGPSAPTSSPEDGK